MTLGKLGLPFSLSCSWIKVQKTYRYNKGVLDEITLHYTANCTAGSKFIESQENDRGIMSREWVDHFK